MTEPHPGTGDHAAELLSTLPASAATQDGEPGEAHDDGDDRHVRRWGWHGWIVVSTPGLAAVWVTTIPAYQDVVVSLGVNGLYLAYLLHWHLVAREKATRGDATTLQSTAPVRRGAP